MDLNTILTLSQKELLDARRNQWFILYTIGFAILSLGLAWFSLSGMGNYGLAGFGRTGASLINLVLLIVPLMGITLGALSLAQEKEKGTLLYLLAQPVRKTDVLLGKFTGLTLALLAALGTGFGLTAVLIAMNGGSAQIREFAILFGLAFLLAVVSLSLGFLISASVRSGATAVGIALFSWLILVFFGDLGLMGTAVTMQLSVNQLFALALLNPLQVFKMAAILDLRSSLDVLGPAGIYAVRTFGSQLLPILIGLLFVWALIPLLLTISVFRKKGAI